MYSKGVPHQDYASVYPNTNHSVPIPPTNALHASALASASSSQSASASGPSMSSTSRSNSQTYSNSLRPPSDDDQTMPTTAASLMREGPRDFTVIKDVGDGSFGTVCLADWKSPLPSGTMLSPMQHPTTRPEYVGKRLVAIKKMKKPFPSWQECMKLKELKSLLTIPPHPNLIPLYDAFLMPTTKELHFVFECMEGNLYQLTKSRKGRPLAAGLVASIYEQIVEGLDHIHRHGYFHRDMKPENLLITTTGLADYPAQQAGSPPERDVLVIVKLADFGLARETLSKPPYTEYVSTRWYRAPEVLLRSRDYSNPVDMWALGTILAELVNLKPLFPGQSEVDQVMQICEILGDPNHSYGRDERGRTNGGGGWDRGIKMARAVGFQFPICKPIRFSRLFSERVPRSLVDCIEDLLRYDPKARLTSSDCLRHEYLTVEAPRLRPPQTKPAVSATAPIRMQPGSALNVAAAQASRAVPPSHSTPLSPQANKPPFGAADVKLKPLASLRQADGSLAIPSFAAQGRAVAQQMDTNSPASPMREEYGQVTGAEIQWSPSGAQGRQPQLHGRESAAALAGYPAFPESASYYAANSNSASHDGRSDIRSNDGTLVQQPGSDAQMSEATVRAGDYGYHSQQQQQQQHQQAQALRAHQFEQYQRQQQQQHQQQQYYADGQPVRTVYDDDLTMAYERERLARAAAAAGQSPYAMQQLGGSGQATFVGHGGSSGDLSQKNGSNASNETIGSRDNREQRRRSKGWGINMSSVFGGGAGVGGSAAAAGMSAQNLVRSPSYGAPPQQPPVASGSAAYMSQPTPAQRIVAEHAAAPAPVPVPPKQAPIDPKKAKKEAEKAAKEAEKARREAQQKAARDRARAVMQKRNQLLASSNSKDPVEWLTGSGSGSMAADELMSSPYRAVPSDKARGKQSTVPGSQLSPSMPSFGSGEFPRSPLQPPFHTMSPEYSGGGGYGPNPTVPASMAWRGVGGGNGYSRVSKARRREYDDDHSMSSFEDAIDPRRASMQSYQTGDSDPGPVTGQQLPPSHHIQRASSSSSLASGPSLSDPRRFAPSLDSHRSSAETRSISSLDQQLITNMENMTAAEARALTPGNVSPGPQHVIGARSSISRQSRANSRASSASAHRQGSASPLHHASGIPRFHPYSHTGQAPIPRK
ncbi:Pkinase-domain-containing protein [Testicularia cyperi]|uniref:Pkinase-domain-containing protein n=1 Tax=Testicularia cyperi TaxID=1882483 RepID=A0A317XW25_9BASI|nr:Pkinase-domain-containing protein [Testicularia cyperi]